jgi:hypothetical protein
MVNPYFQQRVCTFADLADSKKVDIEIYKSALKGGSVPYSTDNIVHLRILLSDKQLFIINAWLIKNPGSKINTYEKYETFLQKNKEIQSLHQSFVKQFSGLLMMPDYVLESKVLRESWGFDKVSIFEGYKQNMKSFQDTKNRLIADHKSSMQEVQDKENSFMEGFIRREPLMAIDKISVQGLPIENILKYTDLEGDKLEAAVSNELLLYKKELGESIMNSSLSIDSLISLLKSKQ